MRIAVVSRAQMAIGRSNAPLYALDASKQLPRRADAVGKEAILTLCKYVVNNLGYEQFWTGKQVDGR